MTTTALHLTRAHGLVLNIVHTTGPQGAGMNLLRAYPDITDDTVYDLVDAEYLTGPTRVELNYGLLHGEGDFRFRLTTRGRYWVTSDPTSCLLRDVLARNRAGGRSRPRLADMLREHHRGTIVAACEAGYLTAHYAGDGRECRTLGDYEFRHARDFALRITGKARDRAIG